MQESPKQQYGALVKIFVTSIAGEADRIHKREYPAAAQEIMLYHHTLLGTVEWREKRFNTKVSGHICLIITGELLTKMGGGEQWNREPV